MAKEHLFHIGRKEFDVQTFRSGGKGGQHQNTTDSGVRIVHKESGAVGESREHKSQKQNKSTAFKRLSENPKFRIWLNQKVYEHDLGKTIEQKVDEMMNEKNIQIETRETGRWEAVESIGE